MRDPEGLLARAGVRGNPDHDQHFLVDDRVLDRLPSYLPAGAGVREHVLEIGAGNGALTARLLDVAGHVTAVERDAELAAFLREEFAEEIAAGDLTVIEGDALEVDLPEFSACVANLPYSVSSQIAFRLLPLKRPLVLMFQREFAERMVAEPGTDDYGRLSVSAQHYADVAVVEPVPKEAFSPQPAVESAVIRALPREPDYEVEDEAFFLDFVKAVFTQRRKTMRNAIRNTVHISGIDDGSAVVDAADEDLMGMGPGKGSPERLAALAALAADVGRDPE
mgnify:CR=1 FL=1